MDKYKGTPRRLPPAQNPNSAPRTNVPRPLGFPANTNGPFEHATRPPTGTNGIRFGPWLFRRLFGVNAVAFIFSPSPAGLGSDLPNPTYTNNIHATVDLGIPNNEFVAFSNESSTIYMPVDAGFLMQDYQRGEFSIPVMEPVYLSPSNAIEVVPEELGVTRFFNNALSRLTREVRQMTLEQSLELQQFLALNINDSRPIYEYTGGIAYAPHMPQPQPFTYTYWNGVTWVLNQQAYQNDYNGWVAREHEHQIRLNQIAENEARAEYQTELQEYEEHILEVKSSQTSWEFVYSKQRIARGNNFAKKRRLADKKSASTNGYSAFLGIINNTYGHEMFDIASAFVDNLYLDASYWRKNPNTGTAPRGYHVEREADGQIIYRPNTWAIALREFRAGNLQLNWSGFATDIVFDQAMDRFIGHLQSGNAEFAVLTDRPVGFSAGPAL